MLFKKKIKKICNLLLIITNKCLYLPINNSNAMRTKDKIIQMLKDEESKLWVALKNSELVFGREHEATKMARARWSTTLEILTKIQNDNI